MPCRGLCDPLGKVIANDMEALKPCLVDRDTLRQSIDKYGVADKVLLLMDGETLESESLDVCHPLGLVFANIMFTLEWRNYHKELE